MNGGYSGAHRSLADYELAFAGNQRGMADFDSFDVCDRIVGSGGTVEGNAEIAGTGLLCVGGEGYGQEECNRDDAVCNR
jgi:hypothetical protein